MGMALGFPGTGYGEQAHRLHWREISHRVKKKHNQYNTFLSNYCFYKLPEMMRNVAFWGTERTENRLIRLRDWGRTGLK